MARIVARPRLRRLGLVSVAVVSVTAVVLSACTAKSQSASPAASSGAPATSASTQPSTTPAVEPAVVRVSAASGQTGVSPITPVKVDVSGGDITKVSLLNDAGAEVKGSLSADKQTWSSAEPLGYGKTYRLTATATNSDGTVSTKESSFTTVQPANLTMPYITTAAGQTITPGVTYGVGQVVKVHFDEPITDRKAAEAALTVTTAPRQEGAFNWFDSQNVYWRTRAYMLTGTKVTITARVYGKNFGGGLYGQADTSTWFKVGPKHVSIADDNTKLVQVYENDKLVRTMPTSMGRHTSIQGDHGLIDLRTNSGPHVVIDGETNINMNSASFGLSKGANSYKTVVPVGVKISYDGEYVHWADWSVWAQGNTDTSHGCLNVSPADSWWFYHFSLAGDIVDVRNTGRPLALWNSGYWNESWATWKAGSALNA